MERFGYKGSMTLDCPSPVASLLHSFLHKSSHCSISFQFVSCLPSIETLSVSWLALPLFHHNLSCHIFCIMHAPEWAARTAEAPSSGITQVAVHRQRPLCSISELIYTDDSHMAMISGRRSIPCLCLPASKSFQRDQPRSDGSTMERPDSRSSTVSSRQSVSSMKHLLPLRLQPNLPQPKVDLASWLDSTSPYLQSPIKFNFDNDSREELTEPSPIPWMPSWQDIRLHNLPPDRYRETPIYSGPGSPMLSRAYFSDEVSCYHCSPKGSVCDELCIVSDYDDALTPNSHSQASVLDYTDTFDADKTRSIQTSTTSFTSSRMSRLSTRYHGEYVHPDEATWMKSSSRSWIEGRVHEAASSPGTNEIEHEQNPFEGWLDSESSRSSSPFSNDEVLDVCISKCKCAFKHLLTIHRH